MDDKSKRPNNKPLTFRTTFRNAIYEACKRRGWRETDGDDWDLHWVERDWMVDVFDSLHLSPWQRVNHFRNQRELCRKDNLVKNLKRYKKQLQKENAKDIEDWDFWPLTYVLPGDYSLFVEEFKRNDSQMWIMKPTGRSQGRGIFLFTKLNQISKWKSDSRYKPENTDAETYVVQRYINNPYLVAGRKFDLRLYALVTSYMPLTVWLHRSGFCRFSSTRYSSSATTMGDQSIHLTNVAIQKKQDGYDDETGGKWLLRDLKLYLMSRYGTTLVDKLFFDMQTVIVNSLKSVQSIMMNDKHCFELYGYDLIFDDSFKAFIIEVNASPSMSANTKEDMELKVGLLGDAFSIIDLENNLHGDEVRVGGFDLVHKGTPISQPASLQYKTHLGCDTPKDQIVRNASVFKPKEEPTEGNDKKKKSKR